ncbi:hypothetical protein HanPSC8_Chr11g0454811 [Helianthus annuus]|nr:hypothetical protein HanPSC8_Chr11g0454811 [Helianthus annuus]
MDISFLEKTLQGGNWDSIGFALKSTRIPSRSSSLFNVFLKILHYPFPLLLTFDRDF